MHTGSTVHRYSGVGVFISFVVTEELLFVLFVIQINEGRQILIMAGSPLPSQ